MNVTLSFIWAELILDTHCSLLPVIVGKRVHIRGRNIEIIMLTVKRVGTRLLWNCIRCRRRICAAFMTSEIIALTALYVAEFPAEFKIMKVVPEKKAWRTHVWKEIFLWSLKLDFKLANNFFQNLEAAEMFARKLEYQNRDYSCSLHTGKTKRG